MRRSSKKSRSKTPSSEENDKPSTAGDEYGPGVLLSPGSVNKVIQTSIEPVESSTAASTPVPNPWSKHAIDSFYRVPDGVQLDSNGNLYSEQVPLRELTIQGLTMLGEDRLYRGDTIDERRTRAAMGLSYIYGGWREMGSDLFTVLNDRPISHKMISNFSYLTEIEDPSIPKALKGMGDETACRILYGIIEAIRPGYELSVDQIRQITTLKMSSWDWEMSATLVLYLGNRGTNDPPGLWRPDPQNDGMCLATPETFKRTKALRDIHVGCKGVMELVIRRFKHQTPKAFTVWKKGHKDEKKYGTNWVKIEYEKGQGRYLVRLNNDWAYMKGDEYDTQVYRWTKDRRFVFPPNVLEVMFAGAKEFQPAGWFYCRE